MLLQPSKIAQFLEPGRFPMFECKETVLSTDDYGAANDDLTFQVDDKTTRHTPQGVIN